MTRAFFDKTPQTWNELEVMVHQAFSEMGYDAHRNHQLETVRGTSAIDVYAIKTSTPIPTLVLCECKYWNKSIPQNVVHGFRTVCADSGAHFGLIISKKGFQSGAGQARKATNVHLMDFEEFQDTFFDDWKTGAMMILAMMHSQLLPIFRASMGKQENGLDLIAREEIEDVDVWNKYSIFFGYNGRYSSYFIENSGFPTIISDPRGSPTNISEITVKSHREYLEVARRALIDATYHFNVPKLYFSEDGKVLDKKLWPQQNQEQQTE